MQEKKLTIEICILIIALLIVFVRWFFVFDEEASAPPIVIDKTAPKEVKVRSLIQSKGENKNPTDYITGLLRLNFNNSDTPGDPGYNLAGLGQPCLTHSQKTVLPNLPVDYIDQVCDDSLDLICAQGIYEGNICLKKLNGDCKFSSDCVPEANFCINSLCQQKGEVINKQCNKDSDCKGVMNTLNHVCDPESKRCVYDIWPNDSGCTNKNQCLYGSSDPDSISCIAPEEEGFVSIAYGTYNSNQLNLDPEFPLAGKFDLKNIYAEVTDQTSGATQRLLIDTANKDVIVFQHKEWLNDGSSYSVKFGSKNAGICVINFPIGSKPELILGSDSKKYLCDSGLKNLQSYCVESDRNEKGLGVSGQVCLYDNNFLTCKQGLECTFDPNLFNFYNTGLENTYVQGTSINGQEIKNIGICKEQSVSWRHSCNNNCLKQYICLEESDINLNTMQYCGYDWEILENRSELNGCPNGEGEDVFTLTDGECKYTINNFCFQDDECAGSGKCTGQYKMSYYNPEDNSFSSSEKDIGNFSQGVSLLISKNYTDDDYNKPSLLGYYFKTGVSWEIHCSLDQGNSYDLYYSISFEDELINGPVFSILKKEDGILHSI